MLLQQTLSLQRPAVMHPAGIGRLPQLRRGSSLHSVTPPHVPKPFLVQPQTSFGCPPRWLQGRDCRAKAADIPAESEKNGPADHLVSVFKVFSDPKCNKKFLALAIGQMLCSVATLMHDSYLPVYVQDELGLSNTKVRIMMQCWSNELVHTAMCGVMGVGCFRMLSLLFGSDSGALLSQSRSDAQYA